MRMQGMSERQYAAHVGLSRGAIQKAKTAGRLVLHAGWFASMRGFRAARRASTTDPSKQRRETAEAKLKPVPDAAVAAVGDTLREQGLAPTGRRWNDVPAGQDSQRGAEGSGTASAAPAHEGRADRPCPGDRARLSGWRARSATRG
jgi:transposase